MSKKAWGMGKVNESPLSAPMKEAVKQSVGYLTYLVSIGKLGVISIISITNPVK
jgi:hypothetical protein